MPLIHSELIGAAIYSVACMVYVVELMEGFINCEGMAITSTMKQEYLQKFLQDCHPIENTIFGEGSQIKINDGVSLWSCLILIGRI